MVQREMNSIVPELLPIRPVPFHSNAMKKNGFGVEVLSRLTCH